MPQSVPARLDHLLWAVPDRAVGITELERRTGVRAAIGGRHQGEGTSNALAGLGDEVYLEIIAPDPEQAGGGLLRRLEPLDAPRLKLWSARTASAEATAEAARAAELTAEVVAMGRTTPAGDRLRWKLVWVGGHDFGALVPFFIDWLDTPHPAARAPQGLTLERFEVRTPRARDLAELFAALSVEQVVTAGSPALVADLRGPGGSLELLGAD